MPDPRLVLLRAPWLDWDGVVARMPGFARTRTIDLPVTTDIDLVPRLAEHVSGKLAELRVHRPHVVGHSLGAAVALELACRVPVAAVTSFCAVGFREPGHHFLNALRIQAFLRIVGSLGPRTRARLLAAAPADLAAMAENAALSRYACQYSFPRPERLADTPVNLVWADRDRLVPPAHAARARAVLPHAEHIVMPDHGHLAPRDDQGGAAAVVHACHVALLRDDRRAI